MRLLLAGLTGWCYRVARRLGISTSATRQELRQAARDLPGAERITVAGPGVGSPFRLLVLGNGPAESPGLAAGATGFPGLLAAALADRLMRPVEVRTLVGEAFDLPTLRSTLEDEQRRGMDALVVSASYRARLAEVPLDRWRWYTSALRRTLVESVDPGTVIRVLSLPWRGAARDAPSQWGGLFGNRVIVVAELAESLLTPDQPALPLRLQAPLRKGEWLGPMFSPQTYLRWADQVAAELAAAHGR